VLCRNVVLKLIHLDDLDAAQQEEGWAGLNLADDILSTIYIYIYIYTERGRGRRSGDETVQV
jgi:hypothetical protein